MRKIFLSVIAASLILFTACDKTEIEDAVRINIIGYVTNAKTNDPIKDVEVEINTSTGSSKTKTDINGKYAFNDLVSGSSANLIKFTKEGFLSDAKWVGGTANVEVLGALPYDETFNGSIELDSLGATLKTTIYYKTESNVIAKGQVVKIVFPCQALGVKMMSDVMATTSDEGIITVEKMPMVYSVSLAATFNDGSYKFDDIFANKVFANGNTKSYTISLNKIGNGSFGILSSDFIGINGQKKEDIAIEKTNYTITFTQAIDTIGLTTGGSKILQSGLFAFSGVATGTYNQKADISADLKTVNISLTFTPATSTLKKGTNYSITIPSLTALNKEEFEEKTITFKTVK